MACTESLRTQAYFDGELDADAAVAVETHLQTCGECASLLRELDSTRRLIRGRAAYHHAGGAVHARVRGALDQEEGGRVRSAGASSGRGRFLVGAATGSAATAMAAALIMLALPQPTRSPLVADVLNAHLRSMMSDHLVDVASSDRHTVKPWFAGRTDVSPPAIDFAAQGYPLVGGRLDYVDGRRAAVVVYRHGAHVIDLFAWSDGHQRLPPAASRNGYRLLFWKSGNIAFAAVSDTGKEELEALASLVKKAGGPG